jgi:hypothetical protein
MRNKVFIGLIGVLLVFGFVLIGCDINGDTNKNPFVGTWSNGTTTSQSIMLRSIQNSISADMEMRNSTGQIILTYVFTENEWEIRRNDIPLEKGKYAYTSTQITTTFTHQYNTTNAQWEEWQDDPQYPLGSNEMIVDYTFLNENTLILGQGENSITYIRGSNSGGITGKDNPAPPPDLQPDAPPNNPNPDNPLELTLTSYENPGVFLDCAYSHLATIEYATIEYGTHYLLSITYDEAVEKITSQLGDNDGWCGLHIGSSFLDLLLNRGNNFVILEHSEFYGEERLVKYENGLETGVLWNKMKDDNTDPPPDPPDPPILPPPTSN